MNKTERDKLNEILKDNDDVVDNTNEIRENKYSDKIKYDVEKFIIFSSKNKELKNNNLDEYNKLIQAECDFLYTNYPDIFNKINEGNMDMSILFKMIKIYKEIEDGKSDQHDASFKVGKLLKEIYIDTAINEKPTTLSPKKNISYMQWKNNQT